MKHAYCIIAHSDQYCLRKLITCLDDVNNDIFIHFDKKSNLFNQKFYAQKSSLYILPKEKSSDIKWGAYSQIEAEMSIIRFAMSKRDYDYYHLLSGQDLPIKSQLYIQSFFLNLPKGTNLIGFKDYTPKDKRNTLKRVVPFHLFRNNLRNKIRFIRFIFRAIEELSSHFQRVLGLRISYLVEYRKGSNWVSITNDFACYVLSQEDTIRNILGKAVICDELLMQTLAWNSEFRDTIFNYNDEYIGNMRNVDWKRGNPYIWRNDDFSELMKSDKLFARKFSSNIDKDIIDKITNEVLKE